MMRTIREIKIDGEFAYVPLTRGYVAVIDCANVPLVEDFNWLAKVEKHTVYAFRTDRSGLRPRSVLLHRVIMKDPDGMQVDHIDGDGLNNLSCNLRTATNAQNRRNQRKRSDNSSGFKGVHWRSDAKKWQAMIKMNGKRKHLGYFATPEDAHAAYCKASAKLHKEFGRTQ